MIAPRKVPISGLRFLEEVEWGFRVIYKWSFRDFAVERMGVLSAPKTYLDAPKNLPGELEVPELAIRIVPYLTLSKGKRIPLWGLPPQSMEDIVALMKQHIEAISGEVTSFDNGVIRAHLPESNLSVSTPIFAKKVPGEMSHTLYVEAPSRFDVAVTGQIALSMLIDGEIISSVRLAKVKTKVRGIRVNSATLRWPELSRPPYVISFTLDGRVVYLGPLVEVVISGRVLKKKVNASLRFPIVWR